MSPVIEVLGEEVAIPDPHAIEELAGQYAKVRDEVGSARDRLLAADKTPSWTGTSAEAFRQNLGDLPGQLSQAHDSYADMASTLTAYGVAIGEWVTRYSALALRANDVMIDLGRTQAALDQATKSGADTTSLQARVAALISELEDLRSQLNALYNQALPDLAAACLRGIQQAESAGISNTLWGTIEQIGGDLESAAGDIAGFLNGAILAPIEDLTPAFEALLTPPPSLAKLSRVLGDVSSLLGTASLLIPGLGEVLLPAMLAVDAAHFGVDAAMVATGDKSKSLLDLAFDGVAVVGDGAGVLGAGADAGDDAIKALGKDSGAVQTLSESQSVWSLMKEGPGHAFSPDTLADGWNKAVDAVKDPLGTGFPKLIDQYKNLGVDAVSSPASVLVHQTTTIVGWGTTAAGDTYTYLTAPKPGS
jgi:hypothetical protein